mmetsp:Transcript_18328/g.33195  ORF Transcript_18328/g.33195 Transcript_18328/m.33195 type:complete len:253 (+) Transcript_18328:444-1202(+)
MRRFGLGESSRLTGLTSVSALALRCCRTASRGKLVEFSTLSTFRLREGLEGERLRLPASFPASGDASLQTLARPGLSGLLASTSLTDAAAASDLEPWSGVSSGVIAAACESALKPDCERSLAGREPDREPPEELERALRILLSGGVIGLAGLASFSDCVGKKGESGMNSLSITGGSSKMAKMLSTTSCTSTIKPTSEPASDVLHELMSRLELLALSGVASKEASAAFRSESAVTAVPTDAGCPGVTSCTGSV